MREEIKTLQSNLKNFKLPNTELIIRQKESDIDQKMLSEINKNKASISNKDLKINQLKEELAQYKYTDTNVRDLARGGAGAGREIGRASWRERV